MTTPGRVAGIVFAGLLALACGDPAGRPLPDLEASTERAVTGLERAVAIASLPGDRFAVAEAGPDSASGRVRRIDPRRPAAGATLTRVPPPGPAGAAVDPDFLSTRRLWWTAGSSMAGIEVEEDDPVALTDLPATAGPVAVGPDGRVYVGVDAGALGAIRDRGRRGPGGAILRLNPEGTVPADNPRGPRDPVWASGLGRAADLAFDADGRVWVADPVARRIVRLGPGEDAGWPVIRGRLDEPLERLAAREIGPLFRSAAWVPDRGAPTAVARLRSPAWGATLAVGLDDGRVVRIRPEGTVRAGAVAGPLDGPVVDLAEGPDGRLWALTPSTLWRIDPPGIAPFERGRGAVADTVAPAPRPY